MTFTHYYHIIGITETHLKTHALPTESTSGGSLNLDQDGVHLAVNIRCSRETKEIVVKILDNDLCRINRLAFQNMCVLKNKSINFIAN